MESYYPISSIGKYFIGSGIFLRFDKAFVIRNLNPSLRWKRICLHSMYLEHLSR